MRFEFALDVPANTLETAPAELECPLTHGVITGVRLFYPPESSGLVHARVRRGLHQVWPLNPEGAFLAHPQEDTWGEYEELLDQPLGVTLQAWNDDDTYPHTIYLAINMLPQAVAERDRETSSLLGRFLRLVGLQ